MMRRVKLFFNKLLLWIYYNFGYNQNRHNLKKLFFLIVK